MLFIKQLFPRTARPGWCRQGLTVETRAGIPGAPWRGHGCRQNPSPAHLGLVLGSPGIGFGLTPPPFGVGLQKSPRALAGGPRVHLRTSRSGCIDAIVFIYLKYLAVGEGAEECKIVFALDSCWMAPPPRQRLAN